MTKTAQEYPVEAMALHTLWQSNAPVDGFNIGQSSEASAEFLTDLAERIATACVQAEIRSSAADQAVPLPSPPIALDAYSRPIVVLYTADGEVRALGAIEADIIRLAIDHYGGRISEVARRLNIGRSTLYRKLEELGIKATGCRS